MVRSVPGILGIFVAVGMKTLSPTTKHIDAPKDDRLRIAIVHVHPVERYPPVTNTIDFFGGKPGVDVLLITAELSPNTSAYEHKDCEIQRIGLRDPNVSLIRNAVKGLCWHWKAAKAIASWRPAVVFYWDPQSALACYLTMRWMGCKAALFVHHARFSLLVSR